MGKTSKWLRQLLKKKSKREKDGGNNNHSNPSSSSSTTTTPNKEKKRWSFRRSSASSSSSSPSCKQLQFNYVVLTTSTTSASPIISNEEAAAIQIQSVFRAYLARKALGALRGIVKLQALVRGQLVRKQAMATLRCMKALLRAQDRACAHRIRINSNQTHSTTHPNITHHCLLTHIYTEMEREVEEKMKKIVEMDVCESKYKYSSRSRKSKREKTHEYPSSQSTNTSSYSYSKQEINNLNHKVSVSSSAQSSPACKIDDSHHHNYSSLLLPNYMSNTESSRAKFRSHSAPKQRPPQYWLERQSSRGKTTKPIMKTMQRSSSHVGVSVTPHNYHYYPCSIVNLDASTVSLVHSECGSTSTLLTNAYNHPHEDRFW